MPDRVATRLAIDPHFVRSAVSAETPPNIGLLVVTARSRDRRQAEALANLTAEELIVELGGTAAPLGTLERAVATPAEDPDVHGPSSRAGRALLLGAFGMLLGVAAAFGVERFDTRIRSRQAAETALAAPVLAVVPASGGADGERLLGRCEAPALIECYRRLATAVDVWTPPTGTVDRRVIVVTSPGAGDGKTRTVAELAAAASELGRPVLAISADLRAPRLHDYFDRPRQPGLTELLAQSNGRASLAGIVTATDIPGVRLVASGEPVENPGSLLDHAGDVLTAARDAAPLVLVDSPPLLSTSDTAELSRHADGVIIVVRAGHTPRADAARCAELLERLEIPLVGAVLVGETVRIRRSLAAPVGRVRRSRRSSPPG